MPAIYQSFEFDETDTIGERQTKLYLGMISCGEEAYTLGAAIAEERKRLDELMRKMEEVDRKCEEIKKEFFAIKERLTSRVQCSG